VCAGSVSTSLTQHPLDNNATPASEQCEGACQLAEYLQCKTTLQVPGMETGLNGHPSPQKLILLTRTLKLIGSCLDDVISWAKALPGANWLRWKNFSILFLLLCLYFQMKAV